MSRTIARYAIFLAVAAGLLGSAAARYDAAAAVPAASPAKAGSDGKWSLADGTPTYHVGHDGAVDWFTASGFLRYGANCLACHGPDGLGSSYAPSLVDSLKTMDYQTFLQTVAGGKATNEAGTQFVMPSLGTNKNVMCYIDDIYVYLKARSDGGVGRGRPAKNQPKTAAAKAAENSCMGP